jgi:A/G-specific adenine glycosylase
VLRKREHEDTPKPSVPDGLAERLQEALLAWYDTAHRDLPWRRTRDPYQVWLSEVMLQQTRTETVIPYFDRFVRDLPTLTALAEAPSEQVMSLWSGLGYYRRARMLQEGARQIVDERSGRFPRSAAELIKVRGIGRYSAGAIASIAFGEPTPLVDGNVERVFARIFLIERELGTAAASRQMWSLAEALVSRSRAGDWNQALMELGATVCLPRAPRCLTCPVLSCCLARARGLEGELPRVRARAKPCLERQVALVAAIDDGVVLLRRRPEGLFGTLWEPPTVPGPASSARAREAFGALIGVPVRRVARVGTVSHVLSHLRLETDVLSARLPDRPQRSLPADSVYDAIEVVPPDRWQSLGMSTFARKVLALAGSVLPSSHQNCPRRRPSSS